jgi:hypothetical protein
MFYNMNAVVAESDVVFITLDTLRYDVAQAAWAAGQLPNFSNWLSPTGWEQRHSPGSFTYAAHHAFFAGFFPTPAQQPKHPRLFATAFAGSETSVANTCVLEAATIVEGLASKGLTTACIGGVGFFNLQTPLSRVLPALFQHRYWNPELGVTNPHSTQAQLELAARFLAQHSERCFLFINVSAIHQPNYFYLNPTDGSQKQDTLESHAAALRYVDEQLSILQEALARRTQRTFVVCCADHGTAYGEAGYQGHRLAHPVVWTVPYLEGWF